ncbi:MAG: hypothetical protein KGQ59_04530 [Bdellovibrionales bacterium]|nr:hypothetical protein [Bdellovibrionales bacterium]
MKSAKINNYSIELWNKVLQEVKETGNMALVARAHELKYQTVFGWVQRARREPMKKKAKALKEQELKLQCLELENQVLKDLQKKRTRRGLATIRRRCLYSRGPYEILGAGCGGLEQIGLLLSSERRGSADAQFGSAVFWVYSES